MRRVKRWFVFASSALAVVLAIASCSDKEVLAPQPKADPEVTSVLPAPDAVIDVTVDTIKIVFSKPVDFATVSSSSIVISPAVELQFDYDSVNMTVLAVPTEELVYGTQYSVTVTDSLRDTDGLPLKEDYTWSFKVRSVAALYVIPDGSGDGSRNHPLGSIQQALDSVGLDPALDIVFVAAGEYHETLIIRRAATAYGGRDPLDEWRQSATDSTVVYGDAINGQKLAAFISGVSGSLSLNNFTFRSRSGSVAGATSYGIICLNSPYVELVGCVVEPGCGAPGAPGIDGVSGANATADSPAKGGKGGTGGYEVGGEWECETYFPICGWICGTIYEATPGERGWCGDGAQTGGLGGPISAYPGQDGADGTLGLNGAGGQATLQLVPAGSFYGLQTHDGVDGTDGGYGCGGGGGGGQSAYPCTYLDPAWPGSPGGNGGAGAAPGTRGTAGTHGGCSVGILLDHSSLTVTNCIVESCSGGDGGSGGTGGDGGLGQAPQPNELDPTGASGGHGGNGGKGGHGGGGAGGTSAAIVTYKSVLHYGSDSHLVPGQAGRGGESAGHPGHDGAQAALYEMGDGE